VAVISLDRMKIGGSNAVCALIVASASIHVIVYPQRGRVPGQMAPLNFH